LLVVPHVGLLFGFPLVASLRFKLLLHRLTNLLLHRLTNLLLDGLVDSLLDGLLDRGGHPVRVEAGHLPDDVDDVRD
jgi:hypothetical protein